MLETESLNSLVSFASNPCHNDSSNKTNQCNLAVPLSLLQHGHFTDATRPCVQLQAAIGSLVTAGDPYCRHPTSRLIVAFGGDSDQKRELNITPSVDDTHRGRYDDYCPRFPWDEPSPSGQSSYAMLFEALS